MRTHSLDAATRPSSSQNRAAQQRTVADNIATLQRQLREQKDQLQEQKQLIKGMQRQHKRRKRVGRIDELCANRSKGCPCTSRVESHGYCCIECAQGNLCTINFHPYEEEEELSP